VPERRVQNGELAIALQKSGTSSKNWGFLTEAQKDVLEKKAVTRRGWETLRSLQERLKTMNE
jgi:hypothetical protein